MSAIAEQTPSSRGLWLRWGLVAVLTLTAYILGARANLPASALMFCVITIPVLAIWALDLLPDAMLATVLPIIYIVAKVGTSQQILSPWTGSVGWIVLAGLILGVVLMQTGLARRIAIGSIRLVGGSFTRLLWGILLAGNLLAPLVPSIMGKAAIMVVICVGICEALNFEKGSKEGAAVLLTGFVSVAASKMAYFTGGADITMAMKLTFNATKVPLTWMQYATHNFLPSVLYSVISLLLILFLLRPKVSGDIVGYIEDQHRKLGKISRDEWKALGILAVLLGFMLTDSLHRVDVGWIMLLLAGTSMLPGMGLMDKNRFEKMPLTAMLFTVGCMTIGSAAVACGMDKIASEALKPLMVGSELYTTVISYVFGCVLNLLMTPLAAYGSMTPALAEAAVQMNINPYLLIYSYGYGLDQYFFPYEYAVLLFFCSMGYAKIKHVVLIFGVRMVIMAAVVAGVYYPYWKFMLGS